MSTGCANAEAVAADPVLATLCSCQNATSTLEEAVAAYKNELDQYTADQQEYFKYQQYVLCRDTGSCTNYDAIYGTQYQEKYNAYKAERRGMRKCFQSYRTDQLTSNANCEDDAGRGWVYDTYQYEGLSKPPCNDTSRPNTTSCATCGTLPERRGYCKRSESQLKLDWSSYFSTNATAPTVTTQPIPPSFDANIQIACCTQTLTDFSANRISIGQVTQNCTNEINNNISNYEENGELPPAPGGEPTAPGGEPTAPVGLQTFAIVLIIVAALVFIAMMIWVGVRLRKRRAAKAASSPPSTEAL